MKIKLWSLLFVAAVLAAGNGCGGSSPSPPLTDPASGAAPTPAAKQAMRGLLDIGNISFYTKGTTPINDPAELKPFASSFSGTVINVTWAQLQPTPGAPLADDNAIDQALGFVTSYNMANPGTPLQVKLRVWGGLAAPTWAQAQAVCNGVGGPINVTYNDQNNDLETGTVGPWWTSTYIAEWRALQAMLAAKYDGNPLIQEVAVTSCASSTDEPFVAWSRGTYQDQGQTQTTINVLQQCGYSDNAQQACLSGAIQDYIAWKQTPIDYPFSIYQVTDKDIPPSPKLSVDPGFTATVMQMCASAGNCILSNQALRNPNDSSDQIVYTTMAQLASTALAIDFQTASPANIMDWCGAVGNGVTLHGSSIEMWGDFGGFLTMTNGPAIMSNLANAVLTQTQPAASPCPPITLAPPPP